MLAKLHDAVFADPNWLYERKFDGERTLARIDERSVQLFSRNGKDNGVSYPELVNALAALALPPLWLDGEVVAFSGGVTSFERLQQRINVQDESTARKSGVAVYYYFFDILYCDGYDLTGLPLAQRKQILKQVLTWRDSLRFTPHRRTAGAAYHAQACARGWEGLIAKRADSRYSEGRSANWLKLKCSVGQEFVIGGFTEPHGGRKGFGALLVGYYKDDSLCYAGKVGTGFTDEQLRSLRRRFRDIEITDSPFATSPDETGVHWLKPQLVCEVDFTEWTKVGKLRHSRFKGLRRDKSPRNVHRESS